MATEPATSGKAAWLVAIVSALGLAGLIVAAQVTNPGLIDGDSYFHVAFARLLPERGFSRSFEWTQFSVWRDRFADKDLLFHLYLTPFALAGGENGGKIAAALAAIAALALIATFPVRHRLRGGALWSLLALGIGWHVIMRLLPVRSHVLTVALTLLWVEALMARRLRWLVALSFLSAWNHLSAPILAVYALLAAVAARWPEGRWDFRPLAATASGLAGGFVLNPYFPNNVGIWWANAVEVMRAVTGGRADVPPGIFGVEFGEEGTRMLLVNHFLPGAAVAVIIVLGLCLGVRLSPRSRTLLHIGAAATALGLVSARFMHEMAVPVAFLVGATLTHDLLGHGLPRRAPALAGARTAAGHIVRRVAVGLAVALALVIYARTSGEIGDLERYRSQRVYRQGVEWLRANVPAGETVFHLNWGDFSPLFFYDRDHRYIVALDPIFLLRADRVRFREWLRLVQQEDPDPVTTIGESFGARHVFVRKSRPLDEAFAGFLRGHPGVEELYDDPYCAVFRLRSP